MNRNKIKKSPKTAKTYLVEVVLSEKKLKNRLAEVLRFIYFRQFKLTLGAGGLVSRKTQFRKRVSRKTQFLLSRAKT